MAKRGKRTIGVGNPQGGAIGTVGLDVAETPLQRFDVPIFDGMAKALGEGSKGLFAASAMVADIAKDASDADYLTTSRDLTTTVQDMQSSWTAGGVSSDPSTAVAQGGAEALAGTIAGQPWNRGPAIGKGANRDWFAATTGDMTTELTRIKSTKEYGNLTQSDKKAMDKLILNTELSYRAKALLHMKEQTKIHKKAELSTARDMKKDAAVGDAGDAGIANTSLATMISSVQEVERMETGATLDDLAVRGAATEAMDDVAQKSIDNLLNSEAPDKAERARQWMAMNTTVEVDGHKISLSDGKRNDLNQLIATSVQGEVGRNTGNSMFATYGDDAAGAQKAIEADPKLTDGMKTAAAAQYEKRRTIVAAQVKRVDQNNVDAAMDKAGKGQMPGDAEMAKLRGPDKRSVRAEVLFWQTYPKGGRVTDKTAKDKWMGMTQPERAELTYDKFLDQFANRFNAADGTRDKAIAAWTSAQNSQLTLETAQGIRLNTLVRSSNKSEAGRIRTYFNSQVASRKTRLWPGNGDNDKRKRAAFEQAAESEFEERNSNERPMSKVEADAMMSDLASQITIDGDEYQAFNVVTELKDEDGDLIKGSADAARVMAGVDVRDRFEVMRWYRRSKGLSSSDPIKLEDVGSFILGEITLKTPPEALVPKLRATLVKNGIPPTPDAMNDWYRRWLINKNGG
jgi:hypothetical protein